MNTTRDTKLKREIVMSLENCACLGRDAYGDYINRLAESLMSKINPEDWDFEESIVNILGELKEYQKVNPQDGLQSAINSLEKLIK